MAKIPVQPPDPEELKAERHVTEIMGPPQGFDGGKPIPEQNVEAEQKPSLEPTAQPGAIPQQADGNKQRPKNQSIVSMQG